MTLTAQEAYDLQALPGEIKALKRQVIAGLRSGFGEAALENARRVLALKEERLAALIAKAAGQERLL